MTARWTDLGAFLRRDLIVISPADRTAALAEWEAITTDERGIDDRLVVGLIGGTGVGKSTLVNALAGAEISASSDRRPTTDRVVAYRHRATQLPSTLPRPDIAEPEVLHDVADLERVIVLDFPDFDSVVAPHHEVVNRFLARLDVLVVLADDMKYADASLFDVLKRLSQSHENLHAVLNKVDRLEVRYPGRWRAVAGEILDDFASKLAHHAGIQARRDGMLAISARNAFLRRSGATPDGAETGDFDAFARLLADYRQEKRRRRAKELNIEARKHALAHRVAAEVLGEEAGARVDRVRSLLEARRGELPGVLDGISPAVFSRRERRGIVAGALERSAGRLGFPLDFLVALAGRLRLARGKTEEAAAELSAERVRDHYRAYFEAASNAVKEARLEAGGLLALPRSRRDHDGVFGGAREELQRALSGADAVLARRSRAWNHVLPGAVAALYAWSVVYPLVREGSLSGSFRALIESLSPTAIVGFVLAVSAAYAVSAAVAWSRQAGRLEAAVTSAEDGLRARAGEAGIRVVSDAMDTVARWQAEREELRRIAEV